MQIINYYVSCFCLVIAVMFNNLYPEKRSFNARATIIINHVPERLCRTYLKPSFINHMEENTVLLILLQICPYVSYLINISNFIAQIQIWRVLSSYIPLVVFMRIPTPGQQSRRFIWPDMIQHWCGEEGRSVGQATGNTMMNKR